MKALEKNDIARGKIQIDQIEEEQEERIFTEVEKLIAEVDINTLSPIQAFMLLSDLKEKLDKEN